MKIQLSSVFQHMGTEQPVTVSFKPEVVNGYPVADSSDTRLILTPEDANHLRVSAEGQVELLIPCDRCLQDVRTMVAYEFSYKVDQRKCIDEEGEPIRFIEDGELDTDTLLMDEVLMNLPMKVLCKEECKGVCPVCGTDLNVSTCDCNAHKAPTKFAEALQKALNERKTN